MIRLEFTKEELEDVLEDLKWWTATHKLENDDFMIKFKEKTERMIIKLEEKEE